MTFVEYKSARGPSRASSLRATILLRAPGYDWCRRGLAGTRRSGHIPRTEDEKRILREVAEGRSPLSSTSSTRREKGSGLDA